MVKTIFFHSLQSRVNLIDPKNHCKEVLQPTRLQTTVLQNLANFNGSLQALYCYQKNEDVGTSNDSGVTYNIVDRARGI